MRQRQAEISRWKWNWNMMNDRKTVFDEETMEKLKEALLRENQDEPQKKKK